MTDVQIEQTRAFVDQLESGSDTYWDMITVGEETTREITLTPELVILYADGVEDYNPWFEGWLMNTGVIEGSSPFGGAIVPPMLLSHFIITVQFDHTKPFPIGSIHTYHDTEMIEPVPVGTTVRFRATAIDKFEKRGRRYVRHEVLVENAETGLLYMKETRDILSR